MKVVITKHFPFGKFTAINMFARLYSKLDEFDIRFIITHPCSYFDIIEHERTHTKQQNNLLGIGFYIWYGIEWFIRIFTNGKAYKNLSFEREARYAEELHGNYNVFIKYKNVDYLLPLYIDDVLNPERLTQYDKNNREINYIEFIPKKDGYADKRNKFDHIKFMTKESDKSS